MTVKVNIIDVTMKELRLILETIDQHANSERRFALATVAAVSGSSYRKPGARMLIADDGASIGAISGGCLEADVKKKAQFVISTGKNRLYRYETSDNEDDEDRIRLGCNGTIFILIEVLDQSLINMLRKIVTKNQPASIGILINKNRLTRDQPGTVMAAWADGTEYRSGMSLELEVEKMLTDNLFLKASSRHIVNQEGASLELFVEYIERPIHLNVFGSGYDVVPLATMAGMLGWEISVFNRKSSSPAHGRFYVEGLAPNNLDDHFDELVSPERVAAVLMSHNYEYDKSVLKALLNRQVGYVGMLGPKSKFENILSEFETNGLIPNDRWIENVHSPIGLNIGANDADEIALAIVAEVMSVFNSKSAVSLKKSVLN